MTLDEALKTIEIAEAEVEWEYPIDYAVAFEKVRRILEQAQTILLEGEPTEIGYPITVKRLQALFFHDES